MMKCLSACCITAIVLLAMPALLTTAKPDTGVDVVPIEGVKNVISTERHGGSGGSDHINSYQTSSAVLSAVALGDFDLEQKVADSFHSLQPKGESSSGWVSMTLPSESQGKLLSLSAKGLRLARVAHFSDSITADRGNVMPTSYVYGYEAALSTIGGELVQEQTTAGNQDGAKRYSF